MSNRLYIILPCYNEEAVLPEACVQLLAKLNQLKDSRKISQDSRLLFVDDGSKDKTWELISQFHSHSPTNISGLKLSRNRGHQNALLAGLMTAKELCDFTISMDVDLQDDINTIDLMVEKHLEGSEVVYGVRSDRSIDTAFKRGTAHSFYKIMQFLGVDLVYDHADFRLMGSRALEGLSEFDEVNLFLRGIVPIIGFKSDVVTYQRGERFAGETKYPLGKMLSFGWQGITALSTKFFPLMTIVGFVVMLIGIGLLGVSVWRSVWGAGGNWVLMSIWLLGGIQIIFTGLIGQYVGKINLETRRRPRYNIDQLLDDSK